MEGEEAWEPDPLSLMTKHPPRVTVSNTRIKLTEGSLGMPCPKDDYGLGWVQIESKFLERKSRHCAGQNHGLVISSK
jgi:hypothetical protein